MTGGNPLFGTGGTALLFWWQGFQRQYVTRCFTKPTLDQLGNAPTFVGNTSISKALVGYAALKAAHFLAEVDIGGEPSQIATNIGNQLLEEAEKSFLENGFIKRFLDGAPDYPDEMVARRLSDDPTSPLFNTRSLFRS